MSALFQVAEAGFAYNGTRVLADVSFSLPAGELVTVAGPNGAGKSTLLTILAGLRAGYTGQCRYRNVELRQWSRREFAREISFVPQSVRIEFPFTAEQVVLMGRTPYCHGLNESAEDWTSVERAMEMTDTVEFRHRDFRSLSGGERQRVILASALAQTPKVLLLDEPAAYLDLRHQLSLYDLLRSLCREGLLAVAVTHDLNLAAAYSDRVLLLHQGKLVEDATPGAAFSRERIAEVFGVWTDVHSGETGRPWIVYGR
ncbi:MAG: ABC transporter ATP-binding protein [Bryobacteraceae bacterium]